MSRSNNPNIANIDREVSQSEEFEDTTSQKPMDLGQPSWVPKSIDNAIQAASPYSRKYKDKLHSFAIQTFYPRGYDPSNNTYNGKLLYKFRDDHQTKDHVGKYSSVLLAFFGINERLLGNTIKNKNSKQRIYYEMSKDPESYSTLKTVALNFIGWTGDFYKPSVEVISFEDDEDQASTPPQPPIKKSGNWLKSINWLNLIGGMFKALFFIPLNIMLIISSTVINTARLLTEFLIGGVIGQAVAMMEKAVRNKLNQGEDKNGLFGFAPLRPSFTDLNAVLYLLWIPLFALKSALQLTHFALRAILSPSQGARAAFYDFKNDGSEILKEEEDNPNPSLLALLIMIPTALITAIALTPLVWMGLMKKETPEKVIKSFAINFYGAIGALASIAITVAFCVFFLPAILQAAFPFLANIAHAVLNGLSNIPLVGAALVTALQTAAYGLTFAFNALAAAMAPMGAFLLSNAIAPTLAALGITLSLSAELVGVVSFIAFLTPAYVASRKLFDMAINSLFLYEDRTKPVVTRAAVNSESFALVDSDIVNREPIVGVDNLAEKKPTLLKRAQSSNYNPMNWGRSSAVKNQPVLPAKEEKVDGDENYNTL
jgi:hypothetical protein